MKCHLGPALDAHLAKSAAAPPPVYLIVGKDEWQRKVIEASLSEAHAFKNRRRSKYSGSSLQAPQLEEELALLDLFAEYRLLYISEAEELKKNLQNSLIDYFKKPEKTLLIILTAETMASTTSLYRCCEECGIVIAAEPLRQRQRESLCKQWLIAYAESSGKTLTPSAAELLISQIGVEYELLINEVEKLMAYVGESRVITHKDVSAISLYINNDLIWQLGECVLERNMRKALILVHNLFQSGLTLIPLVRQLRKQLSTACELLTLKPEDIRKRYPQLKDFMIEKQQRLAHTFGPQKLPLAINACDACELSFKNGCNDDLLLLEQLILRI